MAGQASESGAVVPSAVRLSHLLMSRTLAKRIFGASPSEEDRAQLFESELGSIYSDPPLEQAHDGSSPLMGYDSRRGAGAQDLASIQRELFTWYTSHSLNAQADFIVNFISRAPAQRNIVSIA
jgi:hypothetical protein